MGKAINLGWMCRVAARTSTRSVDVDVDMDMDEHPAAVKVPLEFPKLKLEAMRVP
jgi:hypothetical protein